MTATACSGGGPTTEPAGNSIDIVDFAFQPDAVLVTGGGQVTIHIANNGSVLHNLSIPTLEIAVDYDPGQSSNLIFIVPASDPVEFFCRHHRDRGMTGTLLVRD